MGSISRSVPAWQLSMFSLPILPAAMMLSPLENILPAFYAQHTSIGLSMIGAILLFTRFTDAVTDPLVGYLSDITRTRLGRRKPWLLAGIIVSGVAGYALFTPPPDSGPAYLFWSVSFVYLGWTMIMIPHNAWSSELSRDYSERSRIATYMAVAGLIGGLSVFFVPLLPMFSTTAITAEALAVMGLIFVVALPLCIIGAVVAVPQGVPVSQERPTIRGTLKAVAGNRPFWWFLSVMMISAIVLGMVTILLVFFLDKHLGLGARIPHLFIASMLAGLAGMPLWLAVMRRIGKHRALAWGGLLNLGLLATALFLPPGALVPALVWIICLGLAGGANHVAPVAVMGDIIDYDLWKSGVNRAGNYFAVVGLMKKSVAAVGGALAFFILDLFAFDPRAENLGESGTFGLLFTMTAVPGLLTLVAVIIIWRFPLDARRHEIIRRRLEQRAERQARVSARGPGAATMPAVGT